MTGKEVFHLRPEGEKAFGYAQAVKAGGTIHVAGALSVNEAFEPEHAGDMAAQIEAIYASIRRTLDHFGASLSDVVRETVEVRRLAFPECMVEIEVTATL